MVCKIDIGADELEKLGEKIKEKIEQHLYAHRIQFEITISKLNKIKFTAVKK
jgi:hypothetical protein